MMHISKLQFITSDPSLIEPACKGGVNWVQLRIKDIKPDEYIRVAKGGQEICAAYGATFIVNDNIEVALAANAHGVHAGQQDVLPPALVQELKARGGIIGRTANTIDDIRDLMQGPVDYIGLGPFRFTTTKDNLKPILGLAGYTNIFQQIQDSGMQLPPIVGIGGITAEDVPDLLATGLYGIAVSSAISGAQDVTAAARRLAEAVTMAPIIM